MKDTDLSLCGCDAHWPTRTCLCPGWGTEGVALSTTVTMRHFSDFLQYLTSCLILALCAEPQDKKTSWELVVMILTVQGLNQSRAQRLVLCY